MRVVLVNPPYHFWKPETQFLERVLGHTVPLGLLSIAAYARAHLPGLDIEILDAPACGLTIEAAAQHVAARRPDVVGIGVVTSAVPAARDLAAAVKLACPESLIVAGGPHLGCRGLELLQQEPSIDCGVFGEGEETFRELLNALASKAPLGDIHGLVFRDREGIVRANAPRPLIETLDTIPPPAWDLLPGFPERYPSNVFFSPPGPAASLCTSRGCVYRCRFCDQSTFGWTYRTFSPEYVASAVEELTERHGIRYVVFCDDNFTLDRDRVFRICERLRGLKQRVTWTCDANVMTVSQPMLKAMREAGCWGVSYGVESGSPVILESLGKNIDLGRAREATEWARAEGIRVKGLFILGTPEESRDTLAATRRFLAETPFSTINLSKFTPYPGSELHASLPAGTTLDYSRLNAMNFIVPSRHLDIETLEREYAETIRLFFGQWRVRREYARLFARWDSIQRLASTAPAALRAWLSKEHTQ